MSQAPSHDSTLANDVASFCQQQVPDAQQSRSSFDNSELWTSVAKTGTSLWLDTGDIEAAQALWKQQFVALTTNNTLLNKEVQKGIYDELVPGTAKLLQDKGLSDEGIVQEIAFVLNAVHGLKLVRTFAAAAASIDVHNPTPTRAPTLAALPFISPLNNPPPSSAALTPILMSMAAPTDGR